MSPSANTQSSSTPLSIGLGIVRHHEDKLLDVYFPLLLHRDCSTEEQEMLVSFTELIAKEFPQFLSSAAGQPNREHLLSSEEQKRMAGLLKEAISASWVMKEVLPTLQTLLNLLTQSLNTPPTPPTSVAEPGTFDAQTPYSQTAFTLSVVGDVETAPHSLTAVYHRLMLISTRKMLPHSLSLEGVFGILPNIAWTNHGPIFSQDLNAYKLAHALDPVPLNVTHVDKFPYMINYHIPSGVRIADACRARLGAYLGEGSTVMPAGYVNFNAGTKGKAMIEGRISAGVLVGEESDIGGGASIMGTLSGGGKEIISIDAKCLIGANAGTGISLGFGSTIAAGTYVTAGAKVHLYTQEGKPCDLAGETVIEGNNTVKAIELSGRAQLLFYQDSKSGKLIAKPNPKTIDLNAALHEN